MTTTFDITPARQVVIKKHVTNYRTLLEVGEWPAPGLGEYLRRKQLSDVEIVYGQRVFKGEQPEEEA